MLFGNVFAQDVTVLTAPLPRWNVLASKPMGDFDSLVIPIKRVDKLILIEAEIDSVKGDFIFDTGAPGLVLNASYYRQNAVARVRESVGIAGTSALVFERKVKHLQISDMYFENMIVELTELGHIENKKGVKILGLLGTALFEELDWMIDLRAGQIVFSRRKEIKKVENRKYEKRVGETGIRVPISYINNTIFLNTKMKGKTLSFCFDTGAEMMVVDNYLPRVVMDHVQITKRLNLVGTNGQRLEVYAGEMKAFEMHGIFWEQIPVIVSGLQDLGAVYNFPLDGIIGYDLLEKAKMKVNLSKREMYLYIYE